MICISGIKNYCGISHPTVADLALLYSIFFTPSSQTTEQSPWTANNLSAGPYIPCILLNPKFQYHCHKSLTLVSDPFHKTVAHTLAPCLLKTSFNDIFTIYTDIFLLPSLVQLTLPKFLNRFSISLCTLHGPVLLLIFPSLFIFYFYF
jgi:hypothetical protein